MTRYDNGPEKLVRPARWLTLIGLVVAEALRRAPSLLEALAAVDRLIRPGLERYLGRLPAIGAGRRIHLARTGGVAASAAGITTAARGVSATAAVTARRVTAAAAVAARIVASARRPLRLTRLPARRTSLGFRESA